MEDKKSLLQTKKCCYICGTTQDLHYHHIFYGTANRKKSDEDLMGVYLCGPHHNLSNAGVHFNKALDEKLKKQAEKIWIRTYCKGDNWEAGIEKFIRRYGRNYLDDKDIETVKRTSFEINRRLEKTILYLESELEHNSD